MIGAQAPPSPFLVDAARKGKACPSATGRPITFHCEHGRPVRSPEPPGELTKGCMLPAPIAHGCCDLHVCAGQRVVLAQADELTADAVAECEYRQPLRAFGARGER